MNQRDTITVEGTVIPAEAIAKARAWCIANGGGFSAADFRMALRSRGVPDVYRAAPRLLQRFRRAGLISYRDDTWWPA
jgi:hypothetical protein